MFFVCVCVLSSFGEYFCLVLQCLFFLTSKSSVPEEKPLWGDKICWVCYLSTVKLYYYFSAVKLYPLWVGKNDILNLLFLCSQTVPIVGEKIMCLVCYFSSVELYPNTTFGALKMLVDASTSTFGLVCSDGFGPEEATVACRDLGYPYGLQMCCSAFGYINSPPISRTNMQCTGREQALRDCTYSISMDYCPSRKYASVICSSLSPNTGESQCLLCDRHFHWNASDSVSAVSIPPVLAKVVYIYIYKTISLCCVASLPLLLLLVCVWNILYFVCFMVQCQWVFPSSMYSQERR